MGDIDMTSGWRSPASIVLALAITAVFTSAPAVAAERKLFRPDGAAPYPTLLFVSGCSGFAPAFAPTYYTRTAERMRQAGYLVVFVDYLGARALTSCAGGGVSHAEAGGDIVAAVRELVSQHLARPDEVTVIGWSYGGGATMAALQTLPAKQPAPFQAVMFYPDCRSRGPWQASVDTIVLFGGDDTVAPPSRCEAALQGVAEPARTRIVTYPKAFHAFDVDELPARMTYPFGTIGYDASSAAEAWREVQAFLKRRPR
jgi:dienelactone hydrolase